MAEAGLPDALLGLVGDIEAKGMLGTHAALALTGGIAAPCERQPDDLSGDRSGVAAKRWVDRHVADWRAGLPLRLSPRTAETLIRPARAVERAQSRHQGALCAVLPLCPMAQAISRRRIFGWATT